MIEHPSTAKPNREGSPKSAEDSILLQYATELNQIGIDIYQYEKATNREKKRGVLKNRFNTFLSNPQAFENYFDTLSLIESRDQKTGYTQDFRQEFLAEANRFIDKPPNITPQMIGGWLVLHHKSDLYRPIAEKVLRHWYPRDNVKGAIDFIYKLAQVLLHAANEETFIAVLRVLMGEGELVFRDQRDIDNYLGAPFIDDDTLTKYLQIDEALAYLGEKYEKDFFEEWRKRMLFKNPPDKLSTEIVQAYNRDQRRTRQIIDFVDPKDGNRTVPPGKEKEWPYRLRYEPGPVRVALHKAMEVKERHASFVLPGGRAILMEPVLQNLRKTITEDLKSRKGSPVEARVIRERDKLMTAFHLVPIEVANKIPELIKTNAELRREILREQEHSVSPRGDRMVVIDPVLKDLGFESITFKFASKKPRLLAEVSILSHFFVFELSEELTLEEPDTGRNLITFIERKAFLDHVILSHLRELFCGDRVVPGSENDPLAGEVEREREFRGRRGHRRTLLPGKKISQEAISLAFEEQGWNMVRFNDERRAAGLPIKTYVRITEVSTGTDPIVSRAPHAMDKFHEIIEKGTDLASS